MVCQVFCGVVKLNGIHVQMWRSQSWKRSWMRTLQTSFITQRCVFPQECGESSRNTDNKSRYLHILWYITGLKQKCMFSEHILQIWTYMLGCLMLGGCGRSRGWPGGIFWRGSGLPIFANHISYEKLYLRFQHSKFCQDRILEKRLASRILWIFWFKSDVSAGSCFRRSHGLWLGGDAKTNIV